MKTIVSPTIDNPYRSISIQIIGHGIETVIICKDTVLTNRSTFIFRRPWLNSWLPAIVTGIRKTEDREIYEVKLQSLSA